jgi:hypothetical protein
LNPDQERILIESLAQERYWFSWWWLVGLAVAAAVALVVF